VLLYLSTLTGWTQIVLVWRSVERRRRTLQPLFHQSHDDFIALAERCVLDNDWMCSSGETSWTRCNAEWQKFRILWRVYMTIYLWLYRCCLVIFSCFINFMWLKLMSV
jgi:hypothetical protein